MVRAVVYYAAAVGLLSLFSCEVCPYIESLGRGTMAFLFAVFFTAALVLRRPLERLAIDEAPLALQARRQFLFDFGLFLFVGAAITVFDRIVYGFPVGSGLKALLGAATVGIFFAADSALARERQVVRQVEARGEAIDPSARPFSLTRRFALVALSVLGLMALDLAFLSLRNLQQVAGGGASLQRYQRELLGESAIALAFFLPLTVNLILSFARNLRIYLDHQQRALDEVSRGRFDVRVPVASSDEFGLIAQHTNRMIDGLRERERIRDAFGKLVSPGIAQRLLGSDGIRLGGSRRRVVVLFSDIRDFTTRTEESDPETLVADLNLYFTRMVELVHRHGGVVDKFIGDGMMAIFGLERFESGAEQGVRAAVAMLEAVDALNRSGLSRPIAIGIGLHAGEVVAGTIGSTSRLEFTFIGDTVNVAARIEGLTRSLGASLLISDAVHRALAGDVAKLKWTPRGPQALKGRASKVPVYSLADAEPRADEAAPGTALPRLA